MAMIYEPESQIRLVLFQVEVYSTNHNNYHKVNTLT